MGRKARNARLERDKAAGMYAKTGNINYLKRWNNFRICHQILSDRDL